jgi:hypothetical protein
MPDEDQQDAASRLEPPRLFGRKKGRKTPPPAAQDASPEPDPVDAETTQVIDVDEQATVVEVVEPAHEPAPVPPADTPPPLFADEVDPVDDAADEQEPVAAAPVKPPKEPKQARAPREPLPGRVAAAVTGVLVGLVLVGGTYGALQGCEAVQGTASCGRAGFPLLAVIFVLAIAAGSVLLGRFGVPDPTSTSFLATGMTAVVALLFLIDVIDHWSMVIVIPVVSVLTHLLSHWVTTTFIEPFETARPSPPQEPPANTPADPSETAKTDR